MSGPGDSRSPGAPAAGDMAGLTGTQVSAEALMALEFAPALSGQIPALALARRPGVTATRGAGQGHVIRELRPFGDGDDPRFLDAAASARTGSPQIRSFHEDREGNLMLIADFRPAMLWGTRLRLRSVAAAEVLMRLGWQAMAEGGAVGLITLSARGAELSRPRPRHAGLIRVAAQLARVHDAALQDLRQGMRGGDALDAALAGALRHIPPGAAVALASGLDEPGPGLSGSLAGLARRGPVTLLLIEDALEDAPPATPLPVHHPDRPGAGLVSLAGLAEARRSRARDLQIAGLRLVRLRSDQPLQVAR